MEKQYPPRAMNPEQVKNLLQAIDASPDEALKSQVFSQLGHECFHAEKTEQWLQSFHGNQQEFFDRINVRHESVFWEKLEYNPERTAITLTGKIVDGCVCAFADCAQPPQALCHYCCKSFQEKFFSTLLNRPVAVQIDSGYLLGDDRCSTTIYLK